MSGSRSKTRVNFTHDELARLRREIDEWLALRNSLDGYQQYSTQLAALELCLHQILKALDDALPSLPAAGTAQHVYQKCRDVEQKTVWARQVWRFYADKFDQRDHPDTQLAIKAADEAVWSCFAGVYKSLPAIKRPAAPLPHLEPLYSPYAQPRDMGTVLRNRVVSAPFMREFLAQLPIPTLGLSEACGRAPWWLIYIGHEVGHHLQHDLLADLGLVTKFSAYLLEQAHQAIAEGAAAPPGAADRWSAWGEEVFADAISVYSLGPRAAWAIAELIMGDDVAMLRLGDIGSDADRYPPAVVRLALMAQLPVAPPAQAALALAEVDLARLTQDSSLLDVFGKDLRAPVRDHLQLVPHLAAAIAAWDCGGLGPLRTLCRWQDGLFGPNGQVDLWRDRLRKSDPLALKPSLDAPRLILSGGLAAWAEISQLAHADQRAAQEEKLRERMCDAMINSREAGKRSAQVAPSNADLEAHTATLAQRLLALPTEELGL